MHFNTYFIIFYQNLYLKLYKNIFYLCFLSTYYAKFCCDLSCKSSTFSKKSRMLILGQVNVTASKRVSLIGSSAQLLEEINGGSKTKWITRSRCSTSSDKRNCFQAGARLGWAISWAVLWAVPFFCFMSLRNDQSSRRSRFS